jgi:hypothetical protein
MALSKKDQEDYDVRVGGPVTDEAPTKDDQFGAVTGDAGHEDSPVRTARPDVPIAAVMAGGVGSHKPADPAVFGPDGRLLADVKVADNTDAAAPKK